MVKVAVILSGCGYLDGSEIHESVLSFLALEQAGYSYECFAPDEKQSDVINHLNEKEDASHSRNILEESARIARGRVQALSLLSAQKFDALLMPGGFGAAKNLSDFYAKGTDCSVNGDLSRIVREFYEQKKPIGATCITPAPLAKIFSSINASVTMTLGKSEEFNAKLKEMGAKAVSADVTEMVADETNRVYTTPCYMEPDNLLVMFEGIKKLVAKLSH